MTNINNIKDFTQYLNDNADVLLKNSVEMVPVLRGLVNIIMEFKQDYNEMHLTMCNQYIKELNKTAKNNISQLRSISGLTESVVKKSLKDNLTYNIDKQKDLFSDAFSEINTYCQNKNVNVMPITDFYRAMQTYADGHVSVSARLDRLIEIGLIKKSKYGVSIIFKESLNKRNDVDSLKNLAEAFFQLTSTVIYNKNKHEHMPSLIQRRLRTTQVHPKDSLELTSKANEFSAMCIEQANILFTKYEDDVPSGTYPEISLHVFQYNQNLTEK